ncbi:MAG: Ig-like domain-containing protein [Fluviicoccus sp.]|uniref:Ig-like domain-containing protein n=1 Tax=Fluviicoccus sp. TaxID=2003552 RepID=UPI002722757B|nr:Ig-like domain-containing protein [Fluviicoccus sp.]MDO8330660.1 Ig-like domain-containing protein [Fluviicoccus sp.]
MKKIAYHAGHLPKFPILMLSALVAGCGGPDSIFGESGSVASLAPTVTVTAPLASTPPVIDVALNSKLTATFSKDMNPASIGASAFTVACPAGVPVAGNVTYVAPSRTVTFAPGAVLPANTTCAATISTGVKDTTGLAMEKAFVWTFVTGPAPDITPPRVTVKVPSPSETGVPFNARVIATFNEDMDPATINGNTVILQGPAAGPVSGVVSYAAGARTATFTPSNPATLSAGSVFTATVTTGAKDLAGNAMTANVGWSFTTGPAPDITRPTVTLKVPTTGATDVAINSRVIATFSEDMNPATMTTANLLVKGPGNVAITGTVTYAVGARTATFIPANPATLPASTLMTVTVTSDATDLAGNGLSGDPALLPAASDAVWSFRTGVAPDTTRPTVTLKAPAAGATGIALNSRITATFNEDMDPLSLNESSFTLTGPGVTPVTGMVSYAVGARTAILIPTTPVVLTSGTVYTATVNTGAKDLAGNTLAGNIATPLLAANAVWTFTTGAAPDIAPPTVTLKVPAASAVNVPSNSKVIATFSEDMDPLTITGNTVILQGPGATPIVGTITYAVGARTATFTPTAPATLATGNLYTVTVTTGAKDLAGNAMTNNAGWTFSTSATPDTTPPTVTLKVPTAGATGVAFNSKVIATFDEDMDPATMVGANFSLKGPGATVVNGTINYAAAARTLTFTPNANLPAGTLFTATVSTGAKDLAGNAMTGNAVWSFTTGITADTTPPTVTLKVPAAGAVNVPSNSKVIATFSEDMDPLTITGNTVILQGPGATPIVGTVTYAVGARTATFTPTAPATLATGNLYTVTVTTGAKDLAGNAMTNNSGWTFSTSATPDTTPPLVTLEVPTNAATGVAFNAKVIATFNEDMDPATMVSGNFSLKGPGATVVNGVINYAAAARTLTFTPNANLPAGTLFTATVSTGAKDLAGNAMAANNVWNFTTGAAPDTTRPTVTLQVPNDGATAVASNAKVIATFSEAMDPLTISGNTLILQGPGATLVNGTVTYAAGAKTATFTPNAPLPFATLFTVTATTGARDLADNALLNNVVWTFTTGAAPDTTPPTVTKVNPLDLATGLCLQKTVNATFSENMDPFTLTSSTLTLKVSGGALAAGTVTYDVLNRIATLTPAADLLGNTNYTATVTTGAKDLAGNGLALNKVWSFTTGTQPCGSGTDLGTAASFGNLGGGAGTTNAGTLTVIGGDLGTTAVSTSAITGFHDSANDIYTQTGSNQGAVNGKIYTCTVSTTGPTAAAVNPVACSVATQARADAQTAFNKLAPGLMPGGTDPGAGQLGGLTLAPGIYQAAGGSFGITGSDLTLDAQGDANAVWVFQTATSLTVGAPGAPRSIILINGAQAKNVYWHVGTSATINAAGGGTMVGNIMASAAVSFSTVGNVAIVTLNGRAVGLNASVTMTNTVINVPAP